MLKFTAPSITSFILLAGCVGSADQLGATDDAPSFEEFEASVTREPWEGGVYIVDGDIPIEDIKLLREYYDRHVGGEGALIVDTNGVGGSDNSWGSAAKKKITYCVSRSSFGGNYDTMVAAMTSATGAWEAAADVDFQHLSAYDSSCTASQANVVFDIRQVSNQDYLARAFFPNSSRAMRNVLVDSTSFGNISPWTLTGILRHELGHTLGFRHEHTRSQGADDCFEDDEWRDLTTYDAASVMHYPQCGGSQTGDLVLTAKDKTGAAALYGAPRSTPPTPQDPGTGTPTSATFSGSVASNAWYRPAAFSVVAGTELKVVQTGTGDPDLYVSFGSAPTTTSYACRPYLSGAAETCTLTVPAGATTAHVGVHGYSAATYNLKVSYTKP